MPDETTALAAPELAEAQAEMDALAKSGLNVLDVAHRMVELTARKKEQEAALSDTAAEIAEMERLLLLGFALNQTQSVKVSGKTVYRYTRLLANTPPESFQAAADALAAMGLGHMVKPNINSQSLSALVREYWDSKEDLPADLTAAIKVVELSKIGVRG